MAVVFFPPKIAICAMMFLILGDMSAAIFGISFGKIKIYGNKSLEGTFAMFVVCFFIGINMFWNIHMREYPVALASLVACLTELYEPFGINDNMSITLFSSMALQFGFLRISSCARVDIASLLDPSIVREFIQDTGLKSIRRTGIDMFN